MESCQGGDAGGTRKIDVSHGRAIEVAAASYDPNYDLKTTLEAGHADKASLVRGYVDYGVAIGEKSSV